MSDFSFPNKIMFDIQLNFAANWLFSVENTKNGRFLRTNCCCSNTKQRLCLENDAYTSVSKQEKSVSF